jgi:hypothetical protein
MIGVGFVWQPQYRQMKPSRRKTRPAVVRETEARAVIALGGNEICDRREFGERGLEVLDDLLGDHGTRREAAGSPP